VKRATSAVTMGNSRFLGSLTYLLSVNMSGKIVAYYH
jgi:hypothetical protein